MIERLTGKDAVSANQLSEETGVRQQNLARIIVGKVIAQSRLFTFWRREIPENVRNRQLREILQFTGIKI